MKTRRFITLVTLLAILPAILRATSSSRAAPEPVVGQRAAALPADDAPMHGAYTAIPAYGSAYAYLPLVRRTVSGWNTQLSIQNLTSTETAVWVNFYQDTSVSIHFMELTIPGWSSYLLDLATIPELPSDYSGSAIVFNTMGLVTAAVHLTNGKISYAYSGFAAGAYERIVAALYCNYSLWDSKLIVQNIGNFQAYVEVSYSDGVTNTFTLSPRTSRELDQTTEGHACNDNFFTASITSDQPVAAVAEHFSQDGSQGRVFESLAKGETVQGVSFAVNRYAGWYFSAVIAHNAGDAQTTVTADYEGSPASLNGTPDAGGYVAFNAFVDTYPGYHGSLRLSSSPVQPLDVVSFVVWQEEEGDRNAGYTPAPAMPILSGADVVTPTTYHLYYPLIPVSTTLSADGYLWNTTLVLQNTSAADADIFVYYYDQAGNQAANSPESLTLEPGTSEIISATHRLPIESGIYAAVIESTEPLAGVALLEHVPPNQPPDAPANPSPANGATGVSITPILSWTGGDPDGDAVYYTVFGKETGDSEVTNWCVNITTTSCVAGPLKPNTQYDWGVSADDRTNEKIFSAAWSFTTLNSGYEIFLPLAVR